MDIQTIRQQNLKALVEASGKNASNFALEIGYNQGMMSLLLAGKKSFGEKLARSLEKKAAIPPFSLDKANNEKEISENNAAYNVHETPQRLVPVISFVQAGEAHEACDMYEAGFAEDYLPCPAPHSECTYALKVVGQSMTSPHGRSYPEGSVVFVDPSLRGDVVSGDRVIARFKKTGEVTFKCYISEGGQQFLKALNPGYLPFTDDFEILGKVIGTWTPE